MILDNELKIDANDVRVLNDGGNILRTLTSVFKLYERRGIVAANGEFIEVEFVDNFMRIVKIEKLK